MVYQHPKNKKTDEELWDYNGNNYLPIKPTKFSPFNWKATGMNIGGFGKEKKLLWKQKLIQSIFLLKFLLKLIFYTANRDTKWSADSEGEGISAVEE